MKTIEFKAKSKSDIVLISGTSVLLKNVEYDFKLDTEYILYSSDVIYPTGKKISVLFSEKFFNEHFSIVEKEKTPDGNKDENVFDIQQGVSINIFIRNKGDKDC